MAKTNKKLVWCHKGQTPPVLLRIEEEEAKAMLELEGKGKGKGGEKGKMTASKRLR